ncbi:MAG: GNAT family N-acetyltransferase [Promethearchaeota archaeon]
MVDCLDIEIIDATQDPHYEKLLYRCLAPMPYRKYRTRIEYLQEAIAKGFRKKILLLNDKMVGQIEYAPVEASGYPILGENMVVLHCLWVLRIAQGHRLGQQLIDAMIHDHQDTKAFVTIGLTNHWSPWLKKEHMEFYDFISIASIKVFHKTKHVGEGFTIHLMWRPTPSADKRPTWNPTQLLEGVTFCMAHPLYHPQHQKMKQILQPC